MVEESPLQQTLRGEPQGKTSVYVPFDFSAHTCVYMLLSGMVVCACVCMCKTGRRYRENVLCSLPVLTMQCGTLGEHLSVNNTLLSRIIE